MYGAAGLLPGIHLRTRLRRTSYRFGSKNYYPTGAAGGSTPGGMLCCTELPGFPSLAHLGVFYVNDKFFIRIGILFFF